MKTLSFGRYLGNFYNILNPQSNSFTPKYDNKIRIIMIDDGKLLLPY